MTTLNNAQFATSEQDQANRTITFDLTLKRGLYLLTRPRTLKHSFVTDYCKEITTKRSLINELDDKALQIMLTGSIADQSWTLKVLVLLIDFLIEIILTPSFQQVTALCLDNSHLFNLSNINGLINLRWATFNNNYLTKIEVILAKLLLNFLLNYKWCNLR